MKKTFYLFNPGILSRKDNTLKFTPVDENGDEGQPRYIPIEGVQNLMVFGSLRVNSALLNFLGQQHINVHFFDYYEHYTGSFMARDYLLAGKAQIAQTQHYLQPKKRIAIARAFVEGAAFNMLKNLRYYANRGKDLALPIAQIEQYAQTTAEAADVPTLMGIEGNIRQAYYSAFEIIVPELPFESRSIRPPKNELNALISFGNMLCYTLCLDQLYHTQLTPTISFLHEPGTRRYSLCLDISEIFKPLLVDRTIFAVLNKQIIKAKDFDHGTGRVTLKEPARKKFVEAWENRLKETIKHRSLGRSVSYRHLVRLECYKLAKHLLDIEEYKPFKAWW